MSRKILALDTATEACSAALLYNNHIIERYQVAPRQHTHLILPMLQELLDEAGLKLADLDAIAFGRGPGSFTGVRIATSVAQATAFAWDLPVLPISTLRTLAQGSYRDSQQTHVISAIDARMNEIYYGVYKVEEGIAIEIGRETVCAPDELVLEEGKGALFVGMGSGWDSYHETLLEKTKGLVQQWLPKYYPKAYDVAVLAAHDFRLGKAVSAEQALPVYLRDKVTRT